jgi:hypothetical protein
MIIETHTEWGREFTPEEITRMEDRRAKLLSEGVTYLNHVRYNGIAIREWENEQLANDWVAFVNTFDPPPLKVEIVLNNY